MADSVLDSSENTSNISTDSSLSELTGPGMNNNAGSSSRSGDFVEPMEPSRRGTPTPSNGSFCSMASPMSPDVTTTDNVMKRMEQENRVLKMEVETLKLRIKSLIEENKSLRAASVSIQARAEQEEEFISNTLLKRIQVSTGLFGTSCHRIEVCTYNVSKSLLFASGSKERKGNLSIELRTGGRMSYQRLESKAKPTAS